MSVLEQRIENHLIKRVREAGGMTIKNIPTVAGVPDRLVILPGNRIRFVELKSPTGSTRRAQDAWARKAAKRGVHVVVLNSLEAVDDWVAGEVAQ